MNEEPRHGANQGVVLVRHTWDEAVFPPDTCLAEQYRTEGAPVVLACREMKMN